MCSKQNPIPNYSPLLQRDIKISNKFNSSEVVHFKTFYNCSQEIFDYQILRLAMQYEQSFVKAWVRDNYENGKAGTSSTVHMSLGEVYDCDENLWCLSSGFHTTSEQFVTS